ncbi:hypothetical protein QNO07_22010 [Streptomyces sp. 549]|uniref:hypothetical protein n=1 Tax=Streptomyces sp. 549 TaxID=3049076 RepID=UPI0024C2967F|nr:hypothetical protein [Streptomyces sp. 549]MDK1476061.1 hypothetical protein [Streptomyces sp. 549]
MVTNAPIVVHPPGPSGRRVTTREGGVLGLAHGPEDLAEFLRRAGLDLDEARMDNPTLIEWRGGGPDAWP